MGAASSAARTRAWRVGGSGDRRPYAAVVLTAFYLVGLGWLPAYFGHQACRPAARGGMSRFHAGLDWINCHLRFPPQDRTLEAYAAWLAAVLASVASYWAWQSFRGISEQVEEQRRATFLVHEKTLYEQRLADLAVAIDAQMGLITPQQFRNRPDGHPDPVRRALANCLNIVAVLWVLEKDQTPDRVAARAEMMAAINGNTNLDSYIQIAQSLSAALDRHDLGLAKDGGWYLLFQSIEELLQTCRAALAVGGGNGATTP